MHFSIHIQFYCDCFDICKFFLIFLSVLLFVTSSSSCIHGLVSYNEEWKLSREHSGWTFSDKENKGSGVSRDITYGNLIDHLYDLLGFDRSKYELVLKVVYQFGGGIIAPTVITDDEDLDFFLDEIYPFSIGLLCAYQL